MKSEDWIDPILAAWRQESRLRSLRPLPSGGGRVVRDGRPLINFSSNDYLDFLHRPELIEAARAATADCGVGSGASRLVTGDLAIHEELEATLARQKGYPAALVFGSGFLTNLGVITACVGRNDTVFADRLVHASILDAIRLSGAKLVRFRHNDAEDLGMRMTRDAVAGGRALIVTESVFSMDGDLAPLPAIAAVARAHDAMLLVDEAHATGVFGPSGHGLVAEHGLAGSVNLAMCTFSKALGSYGGAVACSATMRDWLINAARPFIYTTALPPGVCAASLAALHLLEREPGLGIELRRRAATFRRLLQEHGLGTGASESQIVPVVLGDNARTLEVSARLQEQGFLVTAIRPPTVPEGMARLRFSITLAHSEDDLERAARALRACLDAVGTAA
ncbi:MAG TPA: 8-amino-7-oxononanoate synthase [Kiritimatiellia bacterium]|nr:8-amino-7-oxononanoate synthase [Kiritimatiellia bacterium]HMP32894.1 8-amino-7-oxononanoate synthase [Kiritimatiellia bacterium]